MRKAFVPGNHASTFGGNPLAMAAANATLKTMLAGRNIRELSENGRIFSCKIKEACRKNIKLLKKLGEEGLMLACATEYRRRDIVNECHEKGIAHQLHRRQDAAFCSASDYYYKKMLIRRFNILDEVMEGK